MVLAAIAIAACVAVSCGLAMAEIVYGYPVGRDLAKRTMRRRDEQRFHPGDIRDLNEAFRRVIRAFSAE